MAQFTFVLKSRGAQTFDVHLAGCRDIAKVMRSGDGQNAWTAEAVDVAAAVAAEVKDFDEQEMGYRATDFKILPCTRKAIRGTVTPGTGGAK